MKAALIAVLMGQLADPDGGRPSIVPSVRGALLLEDGGVVEVGAGTWFDTAEVVAMGKDHADLRKQNEELIAHANDVPFQYLVAMGVVGTFLGTVAGFFTARAVPK